MTNGLAGKARKPIVSIGMPIYNAERFLQETLESISAQTFGDFEVVMFDDASTDGSGEIAIGFSQKDKRFQYHNNKTNMGPLENGIQVFEMSTGQYFIWAADHDIWKPEMLEQYVSALSNVANAVLVYSPATFINQDGDIIKQPELDKTLSSEIFSSFLHIITGGIKSSAICGLFKVEAMEKTSVYYSIGRDTIFLAELSLSGSFVQLPDSYYFCRQIRAPETSKEKINRYVATTFTEADKLMKAVPLEYMVYNYLCMVQNSNLPREQQGVLNSYILNTFTRLWGINLNSIIKVISDINRDHGLVVQSKRSNSFSRNRRFKGAKHVLDVTTFVESLNHSAFSGFAADVLIKTKGRREVPRYNLAQKKFSSDKQYDVCYLLFDAGKWGGVKGTIAQANGLVDRGYRVCIVCRTAKPDWIDVHTDFIISPDLSTNDIPLSDIIIGTWYPTVPPGFSSKKGICVHYCRGYEALAPELSQQQKSGIERVYNLPTIKIANSPHVGKFLKEKFPGEVYIVRNDIDHSIFYPKQERAWAEGGTIKVVVVGPYEVVWKGIRDCLEACRFFCETYQIPIKVIRASQTPPQPEENQLAQNIGCPYEYRFNLSEEEMAAVYNECDFLISGSYPYVESFGRPAMEALACGLPVVLTDIPAYKDYDEKHDYALFVKPGNTKSMAEAMHKIVKEANLRRQLVQRGIEVSSHYSIEKTIDDLDRSLQDIYRKYVSAVDTMMANPQYYGFSRPEVQAMVDSKAGKILDVGCAAGLMGAELKRTLGAEVWGVEIVDAAAQEADKKLDKVIHSGIEEAMPVLPDHYFDAIILADVLEHLYDPYTILQSFKTKLTLNGEIVASIPNVRHWSVLKELLEGRWDYQDAGILDRTHLRFFTRMSVIKLFNDAGFQIKELKATSLQGSGMPPDVIKALAQTKMDISTLKEEGSHYQYLVKASLRKSAKNTVSIIILTFNQLAYTKECVKSLRKHTPEPYEIIFVDNGSTDGAVKWLKAQVQENKNYKLIENKENLGFARGCNQGIEASGGEYILLLNNDVVVAEGWLSGLLECLKHAPEVGIVGPMTNNISGPQQIIDDTYRSVDYLDKYAVQFQEKHRHRRIPFRRIVGFCMLFKRALAEQIGVLDESFGTGNFEDDDYCLRAALAGYKNYIAGDVFIHHYGSRSFIGNKINYGAALSDNRQIINKKWTLNTATPEGKKLAVLNATELADALYSKGKIDQAVEALINCIKLMPDAKEIYYELTRFFIESRKFSEAWEIVETMPETAGNNLKGLECAGYAKEGLGLDDEAAAFANKMLSLQENYPAALNLKGILAFKKGNKEEAADYFQQAIDADPGYGEAHTNLGVLYWGIEKKDEALTHLKRAFILSPSAPDTSSLFYSVVSSLGIFSEAEADFREASELYPKQKNLAFLYIEVLIQQGKLDAAMLRIEDALASFGLDEGMLNAALAVREKIGPLSIEKTSKKGTLSLCMIVKNEQKNLIRCLKSVRDIVDEMIIVDTGSTDKTKDIATVFGAKLFNFPWTGDFSAARNESLKYATGDWILVLDGDEAISPRDYDELKKLIRKSTSKPAAYAIVTRNYMSNVSAIGWTPKDGQYPEEAGAGWVPSSKVRLVPRRKDIFFSNPVHELLEHSLINAKVPVSSCKIIVHHYGKLDMERDAQKGEDYYLLGKLKYESDPANVKYIYELAKQAHLLKKYEESVELWLKLLSLIEADPQSPDYQVIAKTSQGEPLPEIYIQLASAYLLLNRYNEALKTAHRAMEARVKQKEYVHIYAHCEIIAGSLEKAFSALEELLKTKPDYLPALLLTAIIFCLEGKKEKAQELFQLLRQKHVQITANLNEYAAQLHTNGKKDEALMILHAAIENKFSNQETMKLLEELQKGSS